MPTPELNKALAAFQAELPRVAKGNTADTGSYSYAYADIEDVFGTVLPRLGKHGLAFTAVVTIRDDGQRVLDYALVHASGEERGGCYPLPGQATAQQMGSAITYARRYSLLAVTGVAPGGFAVVVLAACGIRPGRDPVAAAGAVRRGRGRASQTARHHRPGHAARVPSRAHRPRRRQAR